MIGVLISAQKENDREEKLSNDREQWGHPPCSQQHQKRICEQRRRERSKGGVWRFDLSVAHGGCVWWGHGEDEARQKIKTEREFSATTRQSEPWRQQGASSLKYETKVDQKPLDFKTANIDSFDTFIRNHQRTPTYLCTGWWFYNHHFPLQASVSVWKFDWHLIYIKTSHQKCNA